MLWSPQQDKALLDVSEWIKGGSSTPQVFRLFGYAGTGKTTLAKEIVKGIDGEVCFGTFTGKAAHVLRSKGCDNATTIHQLIYQPKFKSKQRLEDLERAFVALRSKLGQAAENDKEYIKLVKEIEEERKNMARPAFSLNGDSVLNKCALLIVDECSMVDSDMGQDLLSFGCKVLVLGDPAQLPPIKGTGFFTEATPNVMLTEIHRQAQENPIIRLATQVRLGNRLSLGQYGESKVIEKKDVQRDEILSVDQILVGKNATRSIYNNRIRTLLGRGQKPEKGDKIVCLCNNHDVGLLNGMVWNIEQIGMTDEDSLNMIIRDGETQLSVDAWLHYFENREKELGWYERREKEQFDYGYALTVHKAQGSQWDNIVVFDESESFREQRDKWLYTALTRAAEKVTVVKMN